VQYRNVKKSAPDLTEMLRHSGGQRRVPVIVEDGTASIGFGGT
jgi:glutaredoxin 3